MRPFNALISLDEARERLARAVQPIARTERVALADAAGRVAARDMSSAISVPPFARSAMDGYAVRAEDVARASADHAIRLRVVDRVFTGQAPQRAVTPGTACEIATGAPVPDGADAVVPVEETRRAGVDVEVLTPSAAGHHIGRRGADISPGDLVVRRGDFLNPSRIGAAAAVGRAELEVYARPKVAVLSTGNEVVAPGRTLGGAQIYDVNSFTLGAIIAAHGGIMDPRAPVADTLEAQEAALEACAGADVIIFSGGSSVGDRDLVADLVERRGTMIFHGIAIKPGKPTAFARIGDTPFFGMPGNPTSCLSNAYILLVPFLRATARLPLFDPRTIDVPLARRINSTAGRHQFYTVRVVDGTAVPAFKGSGDITSLSQADGYIEIPADRSSYEAGEIVTVTYF